MTAQKSTDVGGQPRSVLDLIKRLVHEQPNHTAVSYGSMKVSYRDLDNASSRLASLLLQKQVQPGDFVPVLATRSIEMVACFLGVLKAGACYVPIDVEAWSEERVTWVLETVSARVLVNLGTKTFSRYDSVPVSKLQAIFEPLTPREEVALCHQEYHRLKIKPTDVAYMIFTSGTTSTPKGVMIPHSALLHYVQQGDDETPYNCNATPESKILLIFSPGFDACVGVVFSALCSGAELIISGADDLLECASRSTILVATPSVLAALGEPEQTCVNVETIILGGEAPPPSLLWKWWSPTRRIYNAYGLTETTIMSSISRVVPWKRATLGQPMANTRLLLLDGDEESDEYGEICITGPGLALGYYKNDELTRQKFAFWQGERIYKTGDFARRTEFGLEFTGRADSQVKNRGYLINLESQVLPMLLDEGATTATAFMYQKRLVAFVTPETLDVRALRQALSDKYDDFLVPDQIRTMEAMPLTANGKADNRALRQMLEEQLKMFDSSDEKGDHGLSKMNSLKAAIAAAVSLPIASIRDDDSFWELGGNSLAAVKVVSYLRKRNFTITLKDLFGLPNLAAVCTQIQEDADETVAENRNQLPSMGPMSSLQSKMIQAGIKAPGLNYMLFRICIPSNSGALADPNRLKDAWHQVLQRHAVFRTTFVLDDEQQRVRPEIELDWRNEETTATQLDNVIRERSLEIEREILKIDEFSEEFNPLNILRLITVPGQRSTLLWLVHHAQADGWSLSIIFNEVQDILSNDTTTRPSLPPPTQFINIALAQKKLQTDPSSVFFWTNTFSENHSFPRLDLPKPSPGEVSAQSAWMGRLTIPLGVSKSELEEASRRFRVAPSALIYAAWGLILSNYTFSDGVAFGAVLSGRNLSSKNATNVDSVVGPLINTVPFPIQFGSENQTIAESITAIHEHLMQVVESQWSAAEFMTTMSGESINSAMQTILVTEYDVPPMRGTWTIEQQDIMLEFGLTLMIEKDGADQLQVGTFFDQARLAPAGIRRILTHFRNSMKGFIEPTNILVHDVRAKLLEEVEKSSLIKLPTITGQFKGQMTIKDWLDEAGQKWPNLCAIESEQHGGMTYKELDEASNKLARRLRAHFQRKLLDDRVVCVLSDGSLHWIIAIVAVIKAGGICTTIDITRPIKQIEAIVNTSGSSTFLSANKLCTSAISFRQENGLGRSDLVIVVDEFLEAAAGVDASRLDTITQVEDVVFLVFTSGTTGVPKGVPLHNLSLLHVIAVPEVRLFAAPGRRIAQFLSLTFDCALLEIFGTLCYGGTLVLRNPADPFEHLKRVHATLATPTVVGALLPEDYKHLDTIVLVGEPVPQSMADTWGGQVHLRNGYGPTECGPISTTARLLPGVGVTIGCTLPYVSIYILDHQRCPVPQGITGEIYISGEQITRGYWKNSGPNQIRHVRNPFSSLHGMQFMYRTGDLGYWNEDLTISYVGRIDNQVKVRGFRIELEEVEHAILAAKTSVPVINAAVIVVRDVKAGDKTRIVGIVTPQEVDVADLRSQIASLLPSYMRPSQILTLATLPQTQNRKIDRRVLEDLAVSAWSEAGERGGAGHKSGRLHKELTHTEELIGRVWAELLGLDSSMPIQKDLDFIELGGNSVLIIKAARMIASSVGHHVPVSLLIRQTILRDLARAIDEQSTASMSARDDTFSAYLSKVVVANQSSHPSLAGAPLSYLEEELFHSHNMSDTKSAFNTSFQCVIHGALNHRALVEAFCTVVRENPILRASYDTVGDTPCRTINDEHAFSPSCYSNDEWDAEKMRAAVNQPFDLARDHLIRVIIWDRSGTGTETEVTLITHHIVTDRASISLTLQKVSQTYLDLIAQGEGTSAKRLIQQTQDSAKATYLDWARWLKIGKSNLRSQTKLQFWTEYLRGMVSLPQIKHQRDNDPNGTSPYVNHSGTSQHICIPRPDQDSGSIAYSQRLTVAAVALALRVVLGASDIVLALPYMNRDDPATANMLGLFVDRVPLRLSISGEALTSADALLDAVSSTTHEVIENQMPYKAIQNVVQPVSDVRFALDPFVDVLVIYNWQTDALEQSLSLGGGTKVSAIEAGKAARATGAMFPLLFNFSEQGDGSLVVEMEYNPVMVPVRVVHDLSVVLPKVVLGLAARVRPEVLISASL